MFQAEVGLATKVRHKAMTVSSPEALVIALLVVAAVTLSPVESRASMLPKTSNMKKFECLKTSLYEYELDEYQCRNLGKCYQYFCYDTALRCSSCLPPPCFDPDAANRTRVIHPAFESSAEGKALVKITTSGDDCMGFVVKMNYVNSEGENELAHVIVTSASCLTGFEVECERRANDTTSSCFMQENAKIKRVMKGFRSYSASVSRSGRRIIIPLNSQTVLISRQYMECGDCQHQTATIRLSSSDVMHLRLDGDDQDFFQVVPTQPAREEEGVGAALFGLRNSTMEFMPVSGSLSGIWKKKMCLNASVDVDSLLTRGSPVEVQNDNVTTAATGVVTHTVESADGTTMYSIARFDSSYTSFVTAWLEATWETDTCTRNTSKLYSKFDCYPPYPTAYLNESLCLCSRGWTNERNSCKDAREENMSQCKWNKTERTATCVGLHPAAAYERLVDTVTLPGNIKTLHLTSTNITNIRELSEILRHLDMIQELWVGKNQLRATTASSFKHARKLKALSLAGNRISRMHDDTFRRSKRLNRLIMHDNRLSIIRTGLCRKLVEINFIDLRNNRIKKIEDRAFRKNTKLQHLWLSNNMIESLHGHMFQNNHRLVELKLDNNRISTLSSKFFTSCTQLRYLGLHNNRLESLPRSVFHLNAKLRIVTLSGNHLRKLPGDLFDNNKQLRLAIFRDNKKLPADITRYSGFSSMIQVKNLREYLAKLDPKKRHTTQR